MSEYTLVIRVVGVDQTAPAQKGMEQLGVGGVAVGNILADMAVKAATAVAGMAAGTISAAADFQNAGATFASVAGGALAEAGFTMADVTAKALEMGAVTQFSAGQAQEAMINLAKGGVPVADIMNTATQATLDLAAAGEVGLANAADIVAKQLGVWASTGVTAADVSNVLAQAANASTVGVEELALGLSQVGGVAQVAGVSFQDLNQTMAMIAPGFGSASDAGTSLKGFLLGMVPSTKAAAGTMHELGLMAFDAAGAAKQFGIDISKSGDPLEEIDAAMRQYITSVLGIKQGTEKFETAYTDLYSKFEYSKFYDANGAFLGMENAAGLLQGALAGMGQDAQAAALKVMFGTDSFRAAAFLAKGGAEGFNAMGMAMDAAGTAAEQAAIRNQTFEFAWDSLLGTMETIQIVIGSALLPILTSLVNDALIPAGNAILSFAQGMIQASDPINYLMTTIGGALPIITGIGAAILAYVVPAFIAWAGAAIPAAIGTMAALAPIVLPLLAIGAAVALLTMAWQNNWGGIQDITAAVWAYIQPTFNQLVDWLAVAIPVAIQALAQFWTGTLWPALQVVGQFIVGTVIPALSQVASWLMTNIPIAIQAAVLGFQLISTGAQAVWAAITTAWQNVVTTTTTTWASVVSTVQSVIATISTVISTGIAVVSTIVQAAWNTVVFVTQAAWNAIVAAVSPGVQMVVSVLQSGWATLSSIASSAWAAVVAVVGPALSTVAGIVNSGIATVQAAWSAGWGIVQSVASSVWGTIQGVITGAISMVQSAITGVISFIQSTWGGAQQAAQSQTSAAWNAIQTLITGAMLAIKVAITTGVAVVQTIMRTAWSVVVAAAQNDFGKIPGIIQAGWDKVKAIMGAGVSAITAIAGQMAAAALSLGKNIVSGIISGVGSMGSALADKLKSMAKGALDAAKSALGIKSPSSVMADQVGAPIGQGIASGIQASTPKATAAMADMAGKLVGLVTNATGAFAQLANIGSISTSAVGRFMESMLTVVQMFDIINVATRGPMMASAMQLTGGANKVLETIVKGVEGFAKLSTMGAVPQAAMGQFAAALMQVITTLDEINVQTRGKMMASATQITAGAEKVVGLVGAGAEAFTKLGTMGPVSVVAVHAFGLALGAAIAEIANVARQYSGAGLAFAQSFAESAAKITGMIGPAVEGLNKLRTLGDAVPGSFLKFATYIAVAVQRISEVATWFDGAALAGATRFADGAGKVIALLGTGVDGLTKLTTLGDAIPGMFQKFAVQVFALVQRMSEVAQWISADAVAKAAVFAEGAGKVIGIIGSGVDGFLKLGTLVAPAPAMFHIFADQVYWIVQQISSIAGLLTVDAVAAAAVFAEGAGKVIGLLGSGVDGFLKLGTLVAPAPTAFHIFADQVYWIVQQISSIAGLLTVEAVAAAAVFAEGAGKVIGIIKAGVDGLAALKDMGPVSQASMDLFAAAINQLMQRLAAIAVQFSAESVVAAAAFSDAAGKAVGILKNGIEGLLLLNTFTGTSIEAMNRFGEGVRLAVAKMAELAVLFGTDAIAAATAFANAAGQSTDFLKKGVEGFLKLAELKAIPLEAMNLFAQGVIALVNTIIGLSNVLSNETLAAANAFSNSIDTVITVVLSGLRALSDLGNQAAGLKSFTDTLISTVNQVAEALVNQARPAATNIGLAISYGIADGISAGAPAIQNAVFAAINAALAAARAALGIASPSKVFEQQIGAQMSAGMAVGVMGGMPQVQGAVSAVSAGALSTGPGATTNNNQRSIIFEPGSIVIGGGGGSPYATADAVVSEINRRLGMQGA